MILKDLDTDNKTLIDDYIENNHDAKLQSRSRLETLNGETKIIQGYRLPTKLIFYNINNGRYKKEYFNLARKYGGDLDPRKPEEAKKIQNLLLTLGEKDGGMVLGHTPHYNITSQCRKKLWFADVGLSRAFNDKMYNKIQILEILNNEPRVI